MKTVKPVTAIFKAAISFLFDKAKQHLVMRSSYAFGWFSMSF